MKRHIFEPPNPHDTSAHWTTEKIIFLVYFLIVPIAAIIFLIWVHIRWPEKPVRTKTEVPSQKIEVDEENTVAMNAASFNSADQGMMVLRELESAGKSSWAMSMDERKEDSVRGGDDLEVHVI